MLDVQYVYIIKQEQWLFITEDWLNMENNAASDKEEVI